MRSGERGGAGKKSGYYPAENGGIDKTRVAITADRTNTMIASERNFFSTRPHPTLPPSFPTHPPLPLSAHFFFPPRTNPPNRPSRPRTTPFVRRCCKTLPYVGIKVGVISGERTKGVERGGLTDGGRWWNNVMHTWCLINQLITVLLFCLIKNNESLSVCSVGGRIYEHDRRRHHPPYVSIAFESWPRMSLRYASMLLSIGFLFVTFIFFSLSLSLSIFLFYSSFLSFAPIIYRFVLIVSAFDREFLFFSFSFFFLSFSLMHASVSEFLVDKWRNFAQHPSFRLRQREYYVECIAFWN